MASIALSVIGCIDYLAYGSIFTRVMFRPKIKLDVFSHQKSRRCLPGGGDTVDSAPPPKTVRQVIYHTVPRRNWNILIPLWYFYRRPVFVIKLKIDSDGRVGRIDIIEFV